MANVSAVKVSTGEEIELTFGQHLIGLRLEEIHVWLTFAELLDPRVTNWLGELNCRRANPREPITIEVT